MRKYIFIISLLSAGWVSAQETTDGQPEYKQRYGLRIGVDISKPARSFFDKNYWGLELMGDYRINYRLYAAAELGHEKKTTEEDYFTYTTNGQFLKLGVDYNTYGNWYGMENLVYVGGRYAFSRFSQELNSYSVYKTNQYWNESLAGTNTDWLRTYDGRTAHWLELIIGMKVELLRNFYAGTSIRLGYMIVNTDSGGFPNYWIPGFNRLWEGSNFGMSYNYSLTYLIPLYKKKK
ncbi:MAG: DUF6048 family protein [Capnocytophaga sp.]|nr:DUF6048 family protein [Capnocytophaga sp.]